MRVLLYSINYSPELTGVGKYAGEMCEWLAARGHEVRVITAPPYYPEWRIHEGYSGLGYRTENLRGVRVVRCPLWVPKRATGLKRVLHHLSFAVSTLPVALWQSWWRPDVIMMLEPPIACAPIALLAARLSGARSWLHVQDFEVDAAFDLGLLPAPAKPVVRRAEQFLMRGFDRVSTISQRMFERLAEKGVEKWRSSLFRNWVDCGAIHPLSGSSKLRRKLGVPEAAFVVSYSGNMGEKQGLEVVVEAARLMRDDGCVVFVLCGAGAALARLKVLAAGLDNIRWLPLQPAEALNEFLNMADAHLLPQRADAADLVMPSKLCGMLASGLAVIATVHPGTEIAEALQHAGVITAPGDAAALALAIDQVRRDETSRKNMGVFARQYAERNFSAEAVLGQFERELLQCAEPEPHKAARDSN